MRKMRYLIYTFLTIYIPIAIAASFFLGYRFGKRLGWGRWLVALLFSFVISLPVTWDYYPVKNKLEELCSGDDVVAEILVDPDEWFAKQSNLVKSTEYGPYIRDKTIKGGFESFPNPNIKVTSQYANIWSVIRKVSLVAVDESSGKVLARLSGYYTSVTTNPQYPAEGFYDYKSWLNFKGCASSSDRGSKFHKVMNKFKKYKVLSNESN